MSDERRKLLKLASELARGEGFPSPFLEDHQLPKMSLAAQAYLQKQLDMMDTQCKYLAGELASIGKGVKA